MDWLWRILVGIGGEEARTAIRDYYASHGRRLWLFPVATTLLSLALTALIGLDLPRINLNQTAMEMSQMTGQAYLFFLYPLGLYFLLKLIPTTGNTPASSDPEYLTAGWRWWTFLTVAGGPVLAGLICSVAVGDLVAYPDPPLSSLFGFAGPFLFPGLVYRSLLNPYGRRQPGATVVLMLWTVCDLLIGICSFSRVPVASWQSVGGMSGYAFAILTGAVLAVFLIPLLAWRRTRVTAFGFASFVTTFLILFWPLLDSSWNYSPYVATALGIGLPTLGFPPEFHFMSYWVDVIK